MKRLPLKFHRIRSFVLFVLAFLVCLEILLRLVSYEKGGDLHLFSNFPIGIPPTESEWDHRFEELAETEKNKTHYSRYDSILGWSYRPNSFSKDSLCYFDEHGMRNVFSKLHNCTNDSCLHVLLSGNSYTMSYEVPAEQSIAYYLDSVLNSRGVACQIKIGATANYSVDQSYLEWKYRSHVFEPDLVLLGYNPLHAFGNTTIFHYFSFPETRIFYTKPCAVFEKSDSLNWLNFPTMKINEIKENIVLNFESGPFYEVEHAREAPRVKSFDFELSYLYAIYRRIFNFRPIIPSQVEVDKTRVITEKIIAKFKKELNQEGAKLMLFEIPIFEDLLKQTAGIRSDDDIWRFQGVETIPVRDSLLNELGFQKAYVSSLTHFSRHSNRLIAIQLANAIVD